MEDRPSVAWLFRKSMKDGTILGGSHYGRALRHQIFVANWRHGLVEILTRGKVALDVETNRIAALAVGESEASLFSLSGRDRLRAIFSRLGLPVIDNADEAPAFDSVLIAHAGYVFDERVIADFAKTRLAALVTKGDDGEERLAAAMCRGAEGRRWAERLQSDAETGSIADGEAVTLYTASEISGAYNQRLRKREEPVIARASLQRRDEMERRLFKGSYKGATDFVTKFVLPEPAFHATRLAAALGIHPNAITTASLILVISAFFLFMNGEFAIGLVAAWLMCFLDTVDGKLARVTLQSSKWGNVYDHGIDLIHPPFWYWAWAAGSVTTGELSGFAASNARAALWVILAGYISGRLIEGYFVRRFKIEIHIWRPVDYWFRHVTSRRNPNLAMLTLSAVAGAPIIGLFAVAFWTAASVGFHVIRLIAAEFAAQNGALKSWLAE
jgi:phosphatidylglycerophosphate synthase